MDPVERLRLSLDGLSVGDAFGECFFSDPNGVEERIARRLVPTPAWRWTDDTQMALWQTVAALGDRDTACAIVGGIVALRAPIPAEWLAAREPLTGRMADWDI